MGEKFPFVRLVMALPAESDGVFEAAGIAVLYCGVGKVNAAMCLARELCRYAYAGEPSPLVLNFGTAGSRSHPAGQFVACHSFTQRDMDVCGLGFARGVTPFDTLPALLTFEPVFAHLPGALCESGDSFVTGAVHTGAVHTGAVHTGAVHSAAVREGSVLDMEAYALAKVCRTIEARFACVKYVTDGADDTAAADWHDNLHKAAEEFLRLYLSVQTADGRATLTS